MHPVRTGGTMRIVVKVLAVAMVLAAGFGVGPALAQKRVALVIGIDFYPGLSPEDQLRKAGNDSRAVGDALQTLGFQVMRGRDLGLAAMRKLVADFAGRVGADDIAVIYFAGRGVAVNGVNYLIPTDVPGNGGGSEAALRDATMSETELVSAIRVQHPRLTVLIIDAARENPFPRAADGATLGSDRGLAEARWPDDVFSITSAAPGQVSLERLHADETHRNSIFARSLLEHLHISRLTLEDIAAGTRDRVTALARIVSPDLDRPGPHQQTVTFAGATAAGQTRLNAPAASSAAPSSPQASVWPPKTAPNAPVSQSAATPMPPLVFSGDGSRAILYEEDAADPQGRRSAGSVTWRIERGAETVVHADVSVPDRGLKVTLSLRKNGDRSLPASHVIDFMITSSDPEVQNVPGLLMKHAEATRGVPLAGLAVKSTSRHFIVGLSDVQTDRDRNAELMRNRSWFDLPIVFITGRRAILAIEKGSAGEEVFKQAFAAWETSASR